MARVITNLELSDIFVIVLILMMIYFLIVDPIGRKIKKTIKKKREKNK